MEIKFPFSLSESFGNSRPKASVFRMKLSLKLRLSKQINFTFVDRHTSNGDQISIIIVTHCSITSKPTSFEYLIHSKLFYGSGDFVFFASRSSLALLKLCSHIPFVEYLRVYLSVNRLYFEKLVLASIVP